MKISNQLLLLAMVSSSCVYAGEPNQKDQFQIMDRNNDGAITLQEATGSIELLKNWVYVDHNVNGQIEMSEFSAFEEMQAPAKNFAPQPDEDDPHIGAAPL
jgi:Ca2+-binding EF-hand superfamily protein